MNPGEIFRHDAFYRNSLTGQLERKYLLALARSPAGDIVARLLTSRVHGRPESPRCYHGLPYSGYYLGVLGDPLSTKTWLDLRYLDDLDALYVQRLAQRGIVGVVTTLTGQLFAEALDCVAAADDTTRAQERAIRDQLTALQQR